MAEHSALHATRLSVEALRNRFLGALIEPGDSLYEHARRVWNGMIDKRPALIARCVGVGDVIEAVRFARENDLLVAVRGGGHSVPGHSTCDGGLVIDLGPMKGLWIDPKTQRCRAQAGLTWGEFDRETQLAGLAIPGGQVSSTGIAGLTLGGGIGWLTRKYGLTSDNVRSVEIVTATAERLTVSAEENPDLFWGVRGGGGNFGIVTSFEYQLHPVGPTVLAGSLFYPLEQAREVLCFSRDFIAQAPEELSTCNVLLVIPARAPFPQELWGKRVLNVSACYAGPLQAGERVLAPLRRFRKPLLDFLGPMPYTQLQTMLDVTAPRGLCYWERSEYLDGLSDDAIDTVLEHFADPQAPVGEVILFERSGAATRVPEDASAVSHRQVAYLMWIISHWQPQQDGEAHIQWTRAFSNAMKPFTTGGVYVNGLADEGENRVRAAYSPSNYARLRELKKKYDPTNFFRLNQNIAPGE